MSWIRHRDIHILSVGATTYTSDGRFKVVHEKKENSGTWALRIKYAHPRDSGQYDCQISSKKYTPGAALTFHLDVIGKFYSHVFVE